MSAEDEGQGRRFPLRSDQVLNLLQTLAIVGGLLYGAVELAQFRGEQQRQSRIELARSFMTLEFHEAYMLVLGMPDSLSSEQIYAQYPDDLGKFALLSQTFETVGILVHQGDLDLATVDDFLGTGIIDSWEKLSRFTVEYRRANDAPSIAEWFQWLAERLVEYRATRAPAPAYEAYRSWTP